MSKSPRDFLERQKLSSEIPDIASLSETAPSGNVRISGILRAKTETFISVQFSDAIVDIPIDALRSIESKGPDVPLPPQAGLYVTLEVPEMTRVGIRRNISVGDLNEAVSIKPLMLALGSAAARYAVPAEATERRLEGQRSKLGISTKGNGETRTSFIDHTATTSVETNAGKCTIDTTVHGPNYEEIVKADEVTDTVTDTVDTDTVYSSCNDDNGDESNDD